MPEPDTESREPLFLADAMLVRLARWLRVLGFDTTLAPDAADSQLVEAANAERRVLLTRDRHLVEHLRPDRPLLVSADTPLHQLREVLEHFGLEPPAELFTRCLVCNSELVPASPEEAAERVQGSAHTFEEPVRRCPTCDRLYWSGSHTRRMRAALARELPEWFGDDSGG